MAYLYNDSYYSKNCGYDYANPAFAENADSAAQAIVNGIRPKTVLDVGCAWGYLVGGLRKHGADAYGIDASEYAISQVKDEYKPFCKVSSILDLLPGDFPKKYDLVTCIEVVEHLHEDDSLAAISKLCELGDMVLFSSSPSDIETPSHYNVQQPEYWSKNFAKHGFYRAHGHVATYISPDAILFVKENTDAIEIVESYERDLRLEHTQLIKLIHELQKTKEYLLTAESKVTQDHAEIYSNHEHISNLQDNVRDLQENTRSLQNRIEILNVTRAELQRKHDSLSRIHQNTVKANQGLQKEFLYCKDAISQLQGSTSWRITKPLRWFGSLLRGHKSAQSEKSIDNASGNASIAASRPENAASNKTTPNHLDKILLNQFRNTQPIPSYFAKSDKRWINIVTDSLGPESMAGGVATTLVIASLLANETNLPLRIITRTKITVPKDYYSILKINGVKRPNEVDFYCDSDRDVTGQKNYKLAIGLDDIFIATSWWSATAIDSTLGGKKEFFYIIQEVETFFYPYSDEHLLCSNIMQKENIHYIVNSHYLFDYFKIHEPNICQRGIYFEPAFPCYRKAQFISKEKKTLFFYARPEHKRNLFTYGIHILNKCVDSGILDLNEWTIYCLGANDLDRRFSGGQNFELQFRDGSKAINLGMLSWSEYASFLQEVDLSLSLMYTPHPSYPPFDVAVSGGVVVTNQFANKIKITESENILLSPLNDEDFEECMRKGIALANNTSKRKENYQNSTIPTDWNDTLRATIIQMMEHI